jgi:post-segregation antitoxin (ccd killing protein)
MYGLSYEDVASKLSYDAETGEIHWAVSPAKNIMAGSEAGCVKATRTMKDGRTVSYRYVRLEGRNMLASQVAWLLHHHEWPTGRVVAKDGDPLNLRASNMEISRAVSAKFDRSTKEGRADHSRAWREEFPETRMDSTLRSKFGISLAKYAEMAIAQGGVCAICKKPETDERQGTLKALCVDHNHTTGEVRQLLCNSCNKMIGLACEDVDILSEAVQYLKRHAKGEVVQMIRKDANS